VSIKSSQRLLCSTINPCGKKVVCEFTTASVCMVG
jgi:hypothetical protein